MQKERERQTITEEGESERQSRGRQCLGQLVSFADRFWCLCMCVIRNSSNRKQYVHALHRIEILQQRY